MNESTSFRQIEGRIVIATTTAETLATILKHQPRYLARFFDLALTTAESSMRSEIQRAEGVQIFPVPMVRGINLWRDLFAVASMFFLIRRIRQQLVHSYTPKAGLVTMLASWMFRVPVRVHTFTGLIFPTSKGLKKAVLIGIDRLICSCATHIVPEGAGVRNDLRKFKITRKPLHLIGFGNIAGVNTTLFSRLNLEVRAASTGLREKLGIGSLDFVFCFLGRLNKDKGIPELMSAFAAIEGNVHLLLIGDVDQTAPIGRRLMRMLKEHSRVHMMGFMSDVREALGAADVLVLPSYREGFPNALLQAGAMEVPAIATDINGCNEIVEHGVNGWLVPPRDARALEEAMRNAMGTDRAVREQMGRHARARIQQRFEQRDHWERMVQFYRGLLAARARD